MAARRTVLDVLVAEYGMPEYLSEQLRSPLPIDDFQAAFFLLSELKTFIVSTPAHPRTRAVHARNQWMAMECSYLASSGDPQAPQKTAKNWGVKVRTIERAQKLNPKMLLRTKRTKHRNAALLDAFERARANLGGPKARSTYREKVRHEKG